MSEPGASPDEGPIEDLEDLYENAPCGYVSIRPDGRIFKINRTFASWLGYPPEALVGRRLIELLNIAGRIFFETHFLPLMRMQGRFEEVALDFVAKDGSRLPMLVNASERKDADGGLLFTRLTMFRAVDRRRYERDLLEATAAARTQLSQMQADLSDQQAVAELREQFIAVLGHDLRNPLSAISGGLHILERGGDPARLRQVATMMQRSVSRMAGLIDNMLDFARGRLGGGITLDRGLGDMEFLIHQVTDELLTTHPDQKIELRLDLKALVYCDPRRISQLYSNLLGNALTHGDLGAPIVVEAASSPSSFTLSIANAGKTIPEDMLPIIFEPFARGDKSSLQGLGLGLYISSEIAAAHGGTLSVSSQDDVTRFTFDMPLRP